MASYERAADLYDLLYTDEKDYVAEARLLALLIREACPTARRVLDVGCGTGSHARGLIDAGFSVDGIDLEPSFVEIARAKCPEGSFSVGDMRGFDLPDRYDVVTCLFSAIGYVRTDEVHELGLFTQAQTEAAFCEAGLSVVRKPEVLRTRGLYIGTLENAR